MTPADVLKLIKEKEAKFVDLRFTDTIGKEQHVTIPTRLVDEGFFKDGKMFDGSSIAGWKGINESDMILMPDPSTAVIDPFYEETTLNLTCDVIEPMTMQGYARDPRSLAKRAEAHLKASGIADSALFGPENEFFIFDKVTVSSGMNGCAYEVDAYEGAWNSGKTFEDGNRGHRPGVKGGYFPVPPVDSQQDIRTAMSMACEEMGLKFEVHHHEVATAGQGEINVAANTLTRKADEVQILKYALQNVANGYGKTLTFMPKPIVGDNGNGMHVHQSLQKDGKALFAAISMAAFPTSRSTTSAASSNTRARSTRSPMPAPTATSAWCRDSKRRSSSPTRRAIARPRFAFPGSPTPRAGASRCDFPMPRVILTSCSPACCWRGSTASRTRFIPAIPPTRISTTWSRRKTRKFRRCATPSTWLSNTWTGSGVPQGRRRIHR